MTPKNFIKNFLQMAFYEYNPDSSNSSGMTTPTPENSPGGIIRQAWNWLFGSKEDTDAQRDFYYQQRNAELQYDYDLKRMNAQHALNRSDYDYQMEQESPAMQMQRAKEAGINPVLFASGVSGGSASMPGNSMPSGNDFQFQRGTPSEGINKIINMFSGLQSMRQNAADLRKTGLEADSVALNNRYQDLVNKYFESNAVVDLLSKGADLKGKDANLVKQLLENKFLSDTFEDRVKQESYNAEQQAMNIEQSRLENIQLQENLKEFLATRGLRLEQMSLSNDKDRAILQKYADDHNISIKELVHYDDQHVLNFNQSVLQEQQLENAIQDYIRKGQSIESIYRTGYDVGTLSDNFRSHYMNYGTYYNENAKPGSNGYDKYKYMQEHAYPHKNSQSNWRKNRQAKRITF